MLDKRSGRLLAAALAGLLAAGCGGGDVPPDPGGPGEFCPPPDEAPALIVKGEPERAVSGLNPWNPGDGGRSGDLISLSSEEERSFALFSEILREDEFRRMLASDGAEIIPDHLVPYGDRLLAYYSSGERSIVVCDTGLHWFQRLLPGDCENSRVARAFWIGDGQLIILTDSGQTQRIDSYRVDEETLETIFVSPEDKRLLDVNPDGDEELCCSLADVCGTDRTPSRPEDRPPGSGPAVSAEDAGKERDGVEILTIPVPRPEEK